MNKNKQFVFIFSIFFIFGQNLAFSKVTNYLVRQTKFKLYTPKNWQVAPNFLGAELTFLGEYKNGRRPILAIKYTPLKNYIINEDDMEKSQTNYQAGRKKWLSKNNGKLESFFPYKKYDWKKKKNVHSIGYKYHLRGHLFTEMNYFFKCNGQIFNLSTLMTEPQVKENQKTLDKFLASLDC